MYTNDDIILQYCYCNYININYNINTYNFARNIKC